MQFQEGNIPAIYIRVILAAVLTLAVGSVGCGWMDSDGPKSLDEAKTRMEARVDSWCACYLKAQKFDREKAKETTLCMNLLPGGKFEMKMAASANLAENLFSFPKLSSLKMAK